MDSINVGELVERLGSDEDGVRKMAAFKLQSNIGDPSFADIFLVERGLPKLQDLVLHASGNTLAYSLTSFSRLLEVDKGWDIVNHDMVERVIHLVVTHPLVNILRGAMSILACVVSQPYTSSITIPHPEAVGFRALKPGIAIHPQFLEMLVSRLSSADHALCANALQLINSLMREAITNEAESEWPKLIKRLQDLGVIQGVYSLMQSSAVQDLSQPLLEFQALTRVLLRKWRDLPVDLEKTDHRRALKGIHAASNPPEKPIPVVENGEDDSKQKPSHNPDKWRRLGFETETPAWEFEDVGYLGMMDLTDYVRRFEDGFQKLLLEQSTRPPEQRCPIARASLAVTAILFEHFEVDKADVNDAKYHLAFESKNNFDKMFKPLILQWSVLHVSGLQAFFRLWNATGAVLEDFNKIYDLVRILLETVIATATRTRDIEDVQADMASYQLDRLRRLQMELLEMTHEEIWELHLKSIKDELSYEALEFVKEQRIRCLLSGAWFSNSKDDDSGDQKKQFRYARLATNRKHLHWGDFDMRGDSDPEVDDLPNHIDLSAVTSVTSNVTPPTTFNNKSSTTSSVSTVRNAQPPLSQHPQTRITISGYLLSRPTTPRPTLNQTSTSLVHQTTNGGGSSGTTKHSRSQSHAQNGGSSHGHHHHHNHNHTGPIGSLLTLSPANPTLASEWLDGLLMLLDQEPITRETSKLLTLIQDYGLKIRLLNVRFDEMGLGPGFGGNGSNANGNGENNGDGVSATGKGDSGGAVVVVEGPEMPSREGVDEEFWYDDFGG